MRLLPNEKEELQLRPHVLAWLPRYLLAASFALWGAALAWMYRSNWWVQTQDRAWWEVWKFLYGNAPSAYILMVFGLALVGAAVSVAMIRWRIFFLFVAVGVLVTGLSIWLADNAYATAVPLLLATASVPYLMWVELDRRSHLFILTNLRILFRGGAVVRRERQLRYESITDLDGSQGPLGRLLGYGTLIPVTQSGFGLGADSSEAHVGVGAGAKKGGLGAGIGVAAGGGKEVQVGRARSFHQLTGVRPYGDVKYLLETLIQEATATPYLREQVALQRRMADALDRLQGHGQSIREAGGSDGDPPIVDGELAD